MNIRFQVMRFARFIFMIARACACISSRSDPSDDCGKAGDRRRFDPYLGNCIVYSKMDNGGWAQAMTGPCAGRCP